MTETIVFLILLALLVAASLQSRHRAKSDDELEERLAEFREDAKMFKALVHICHEKYVNEMRPLIQEWIGAWSEFDWGKIAHRVKGEPPSVDDWWERWRSEKLAVHEGQSHKYLDGFLAITTSVEQLEDILDNDLLDDDDREKILSLYEWGDHRLHHPLRSIRAYTLLFEVGSLAEMPDQFAWHDAESPDEKAATQQRSSFLEFLNVVGDSFLEIEREIETDRGSD